MEKLPWLLVLCFGCLSVFNFLRYLEVDSRFNRLELENWSKDVVKDRSRRDAPKMLDENVQNILSSIETLTDFVQKQSNETFNGEINQALEKFFMQFPTKNICKQFVTQCGCKEKCTTIDKDSSDVKSTAKFIRGPPGPPGPRGLSLEPPRLIKSSLDDRIVNLTDSTTFECSFSGNPLPEISWKSSAKNAKTITWKNKENLEVSSRMIISNISWSDQGPIECRAKSLLGEVSVSGNLHTLSHPVINTTKALVFAPQGVDFHFPLCQVRSNPPAKITWKRIFWSLPAGRFHIREKELLIKDVRYSDEGFYVCEAENMLGKAQMTVQLKIRSLELQSSSPSFIQTTKNVTSIECSAYGNTRIMTGTITRSGMPIPSVSESIKANLLNVKAVVSENGTYLCTVRSGSEKVNSATVVKILPPEKTEKTNLNPETSLPSIIALAGDVVNISCFAYGNTQYMNGTITNADVPVQNVTIITKDDLFLVKALVVDDGTFVCTIRNETDDKVIVENISRVIFLPFKSNLLTITQNQVIGKWLKESRKFGRYTNCLRTSYYSKHMNRAGFYSACGFEYESDSISSSRRNNGKDNTVTIFKLLENNSRIFGAFTDKPWIWNKRIADSNQTFIFELNPPRKYPTVNNGKNSMCRDVKSGPCFGDNELVVEAMDGGFWYVTRRNSFVFGSSPSLFRYKYAQMETFYMSNINN